MNKYTKKTERTFTLWGEFWIDPDSGSIHVGGSQDRRDTFTLLNFDGPHYESVTFRRWTSEEKREIRKICSSPDPRTNAFVQSVDDLLYQIPRIFIEDWSFVDEEDKPIVVKQNSEELGLVPGRGIITNVLSQETFEEWRSLPTVMQDYFSSRARFALETDGRGETDPRLSPKVLEENLTKDGTVSNKKDEKETEVNRNPFFEEVTLNDLN